ncbi:MAG: type III pantothenate kinase [Acholeplasmataceae bacterium]
MFLLFDVGNTNINIGIVTDDSIEKTYRLNTEVNRTADEYYIQIKHLFDPEDVSRVAISSVVPRITEKLIDISRRHLGREPLVIGPGIRTGIRIQTDHPKEVGADLICDAVAVMDNEQPMLVIDLGTANKYIYVKNRTILGVIISPGVALSIKALVGNTALLPDIDIEVPRRVMGTNTIECMQSGVTFGVAAQVDGLIDRIANERHESFDVVLTGGLSELIEPLITKPVKRDADLLLKGLMDVLKRNEA